MKKIFIFLITILFLFVLVNYSYAETIKYKDWKTGDQNYYDINNYSELYSVFEDLNYDYDRLVEEYHSLEKSIEEKNEKINELQEKLNEIEQEKVDNKEETGKFIVQLFWIAIIIAIIYFIYNMIKISVDKRKSK